MRGLPRIDRLTDAPGEIRAGEITVVQRCYRADGTMSRLIGLLGTPDLAPDEGLWIPGCGSVHTFGMRKPIRCAFIDHTGRIIDVVDVPPRRISGRRSARAVLEVPIDVGLGLTRGQLLRFSGGVGSSSIASSSRRRRR